MESFKDEICYGALLNAQAKPVGASSILSRLLTAAQSAFPFASFSLRHTDGIIKLFSEQGVNFAILDVQTASKLRALDHVPGTRSEAVVETRVLMKRHSKSATPFNVSINLFGPESIAEEVSLALSKVKAFLQHPQTLDANIEYRNPDFLTFPEVKVNMKDCVGIGTLSWKADHLKRDIENMLGSLGHEMDNADIGPIAGLKSTLKQHQKDGTRFILQREDPLLGKQLSSRLYQAIGAQYAEQEEAGVALGGLIADVMGLGKTLTTLVSILRSKDNAVEFGYFNHQMKLVGIEIIPTKATLVVVPSAQILENWEAEVETHFMTGALRYMRFHGQRRPQDLQTLTEYDIVFTTYATLAADHRGQALLYRIAWYRIVLDEAHWIRNSSSKQFKAAEGLHARSRWCLTGTPIQNKLEDLVSLARFLRLPPISSTQSFQTHIMKPLSEPQADSKPLRAYMETYCLRRSEICLSLPTSNERPILLHLSPAEQTIYDRVMDDTRRQIDDMVSTGATGRCTKLFTALLRMRMICNLGTFPLTRAADLSTTFSHLGLSSSLKHDCERCSTMDEDTLMLLSTCEVCPDCKRPLHQRSPSPLPRATFGPSNSEAEDAGAMFGVVTNTFEGSTQQEGFSTKLAAVVQNVANTSNSENKAIIFSYWKTTLHVLARLLGQAGVKCLQVDGDASYADRSYRLKAFKENPDVQVLLMTIETGAVGLNLTVANQVHIVEPQWNPSVEEQAIARAVRMGQTREVTVFRYVLQNTVEQNVVRLQKKKSGLAKFTLAGADQNVTDALQELETVLDLKSKKRAASET